LKKEGGSGRGEKSGAPQSKEGGDPFTAVDRKEKQEVKRTPGGKEKKEKKGKLFLPGEGKKKGGGSQSKDCWKEKNYHKGKKRREGKRPSREDDLKRMAWGGIENEENYRRKESFRFRKRGVELYSIEGKSQGGEKKKKKYYY